MGKEKERKERGGEKKTPQNIFLVTTLFRAATEN